MKKIIYLIALVIAVFMVACDPIVDNVGVGEVITSADEIEATITPITLNGENTNKARVHCTSPVSCQWLAGPTTYVSNDTTVLLFGSGEQTIELTVMANDGTTYSKSYTVDVDTMYYEVPDQWEMLCGSDSKTWVWATDVTASAFNGSAAGYCYGNGAYFVSNAPGWWKCGESELEELGVADDEMTFSLTGGKLTLVTGSTNSAMEAGTYTGTFTFDMTDQTAYPYSGFTSATGSSSYYNIGTMTFSSTVSVSRGFSPNVTGTPWFTTLDILYLDDDLMVLETPESTASAWYTAWFWVFKRKGYTF